MLAEIISEETLNGAGIAAYRARVEARSGLTLEQLINLALETEAQGARPEEVRAIFDGRFS